MNKFIIDNNNQENTKRFSSYSPEVTLHGTGLEPETFEFPTYIPNYLTRLNDLTLAIDYVCIPKIFILYIRGVLSFDYVSLFFCM